MALERGLNDPALHAAAAAVHESNFAPARFRGRIDVVGDDPRNIARRERVQIDLAFDRDSQSIVHFRFQICFRVGDCSIQTRNPGSRIFHSIWNLKSEL
jgi:hypothetical protein